MAAALRLGAQICDSLADAHAAGVVHRDLKPANVMIVERGAARHFVKVVDFGLIKPLERDADEGEVTADNVVLGSPLYMSPERFIEQGVNTPAIDVYAFGRDALRDDRGAPAVHTRLLLDDAPPDPRARQR